MVELEYFKKLKDFHTIVYTIYIEHILSIIFNLPDKSFGFTINNVNEDLPVIGIIDTGISAETPLKDLIINNDNFI